MYLKRITANDNDIDVKAYATLKAILLTAGADAASISLYDGADASGTPFMVLKCPAGDSRFIPFGDEGFSAKTAISVVLAGTAPEAYLYLE